MAENIGSVAAPATSAEVGDMQQGTKASMSETPQGGEVNPSFLENKNEGVLRDVLDELDRERSQRAELEARVRQLQQDLHSQKQQNAQSHSTLSSRDFVALQAERDGYLQLINALTIDRPVFAKAEASTKKASRKPSNQPKSLPLHVIRLLEIIPWDPRALPHLFGQETLYEWQMMGADKSWQPQLRYFPTVFKTLPIVVPQPGKTVGEAPTSSSPPKQCVLTNLQVTHIVNIDKGYPLPQDGGDWTWVGGWRIERSMHVDEEGWAYSNDVDLTQESSYYPAFKPPQKGTKNLVRRRRKWSRTRVMVDYPQASTYTRHYLKLLAEKASLDVSAEKMSTQLVETKTKLTALESDHLTLQEDTTRQFSQLKRTIDEQNHLLRLLQPEEELMAPSGDSKLSNKKGQGVQEMRSAVSSWVSSTVAKRSTSDESKLYDVEGSATKSAASTEFKQHLESLKGKGTDFLEKIKQKGGEELERIKKQNRSGGLASWATASAQKTKPMEEPGSVKETPPGPTMI
eukprot:Nitzschia sp. Nitz4//scaffold137_size62074//3836//5380//NITZ4_006404-RA/size62074-processed-gene-0.78-mRNA-1//-1//CDS//3329535667//6386//frame0